MAGGLRFAGSSWRSWRGKWPLLFLLVALSFVRWTKGAGFVDLYSLLIRPFWPGSAQREWIQTGIQVEQQARLILLEQDNQRLRDMLSLNGGSNSGLISAAVISRKSSGWWQQLDLGQGLLAGVEEGDAVIGPGGLLGVIDSVTPTTARVRLLTAPGSRIGVWIARTKTHGILLGTGTNRPQLRFLDKAPDLQPGDLVSTSPASTLMPPNLPIGVIQTLDSKALPLPTGRVQLLASPEAIDWVQVQKL